MESISHRGTSSANLHAPDALDSVPESSSPAPNQTAPVLSERKTSPEPLLGQNGEKAAYKQYFGELVVSQLLASKPRDGSSVQHHFAYAAASILLMQESDQQSSIITLFDLLKHRVDIYAKKAPVMGSGAVSESRETAQDMLRILKKLAEHESLRLDEPNHAALQQLLIALETRLNMEYQVRNDKKNGLHVVLLNPKSS